MLQASKYILIDISSIDFLNFTMIKIRINLKQEHNINSCWNSKCIIKVI